MWISKKAVRDSAITSSSSQLCLNSLWLQCKEFGIETGILMSFKNNGISKVAKSLTGPIPCLFQLVNLMPANRCLSTIENSVESAPQDASVSLSNTLPSIKFKRLDKTARHIMQIRDKEAVEEVKAKRDIPDIKPGYVVQLKVEVPENKRRVSIGKGVVIARRNAGISTTFRLRRLVAGWG